MFGKEKSTWEELSGIFTAQIEIYQQPATWAKTIAQIKNEKEEHLNEIHGTCIKQSDPDL